MDKENKVRDAAAALHAAVVDAKKDGLTVQWPTTLDGLLAIAISTTAKALPADEPSEPTRKRVKPVASTE